MFQFHGDRVDHPGKETNSIIRGLLGSEGGGIFLFFVWLFLVFAGVGVTLDRSARFSPVFGWAMLLAAAVILVVTMDRWVKVYPGLAFLAAFRSCSSFIEGHLPLGASK